MAKVFVHDGPCDSISDDATPGLLFLKIMIPALDSLEPSVSTLSQFLASNAHFIFNGGPPATKDGVLAMLSARGDSLSDIRHDIKRAWDLEKDGGKRTLIFECVSVSVFKKDRQNTEVKVAESTVVELEPTEGGFLGLAAVELRTYMDPSPIRQHVAKLEKV
jgi:hypothetical protein